MKNSPYLDKPLRSEREVKMEALLRRMIRDWPQADLGIDHGGGYTMHALVDYIYEAKEILK